MKLIMIIFIVFSLLLTGCKGEKQVSSIAPSSKVEVSSEQQQANNSSKQESSSTQQPSSKEQDVLVDYDLTTMSATIVYGQIYELVFNPDDYIGKTFKLEGSFESQYASEDEFLYFVVINDALGCCPQGVELSFKDESIMPEVFSKVQVIGEFKTMQTNDYTYGYIDVASIEVVE